MSGLLGKELLASGIHLVGAIDRVVHAEGLQVGASGGNLLAGASSRSLLAGASGLLSEELLALGVLLVGAIDRIIHAEGLQVGASGSNLLAGASGFEATSQVGPIGQRFLPSGGFVATCDRLLS